jgi:ElaB/YqjD/DUF883 family membrane-anchored ribosome-binding protein
MRATWFAAVTALSMVGFAGTAAGEKLDLDPQVKYAPSWDAAVEEAKLLNLPIVVHSHGFYCGPCWGLHSGILKNKKYIEFSDKNTVEVICLGSLQEGIDKKDDRAETYEVEKDAKKVEYMKEFPGMTVAQMLALGSSKGASYNNTGHVPYTCMVDPYTLEEVTKWEGGGASAGAIEEAVAEFRKKLDKEHGKGVSRKEIRALDESEEKILELQKKGEFAGALTEITKVTGKAKEWPEPMTARLTKAKDAVVAAAKAEVDRLEELAGTDRAEAKKGLAKIATKLKGTGLEERVKTLLASWAAAPAGS